MQLGEFGQENLAKKRKFDVADAPRIEPIDYGGQTNVYGGRHVLHVFALLELKQKFLIIVSLAALPKFYQVSLLPEVQNFLSTRHLFVIDSVSSYWNLSLELSYFQKSHSSNFLFGTTVLVQFFFVSVSEMFRKLVGKI